MARASKVTSIIDRYKLTFVIFHRNYSSIGTLYYRPTQSSQKRFARAVGKLHEKKKLKVYQNFGEPDIYLYEVK